MRIIDRYMLRQFVQTFLICYFSLTGVFVVFDAFTNLEAFLHCAKGVQLLKLMGTYYAFQSIYFFDRTSSLLALMAAMFTVAWIQRHHEMTALMAAGISRIRIVTPVIVAAIFITLFAAANRETVLPRLRDELSKRPGDLRGTTAEELAPQYDNQTDILIRGKFVYEAQSRIEKPDFLLPPVLADHGKQLQAENAYYTPPQDGHPGGYLLDGVQEPKGLAKAASMTLQGRPVIITPRDAADWLQLDQCFVVSDLSLDQLNGGRAFRSFASTLELIRALRNRSVDFGADIRVTIHSRVVQPLLDITLFFLGLPLVVSRESRNVFMAIGLCFVVVTIFLLINIASQQLGSGGLISPAMAAWAPLMLFAPAAMALGESMWQR
jgi:lipopolysaccharide export system permease protein